MPAPEVIQGQPGVIAGFMSARHAKPFIPGPTLQDLEFPPCPSTRNVTVSEPVIIRGRTVFLDRPVEIRIEPAKAPVTRFGVNGDLVTATPDSLKTEFRNFSVGGVKVAEHPMALATALGLRADFNLSRGSFPNFNEGMAEVLKAIRPKLVDLGPAKLITVSEPIAIVFNGGSYVIFEPDTGERQLVLDHQFSHPKNVLKDQRILVTLGSQLFAYFADARTPSFGFKTLIAKGALKLLGLPRIFPTSLTLDNVIYADTDRFLNPNAKYDIDGINREPLFHELIDKMGPLAALGGLEGARFVGKVTFKGTNHSRDIAAINVIKHFLTEA